jgi:hypothetical protein
VDRDLRHRGEPLVAASALFVVANIAHTIDHVRQGVGRLSGEVLAGGTLISIFAALTLFLALSRHPRTASVATIVGFASALGIAAAHIAPHWSVLSDSYLDLRVDVGSWVIVSIEIAAGFALGVVGLRERRLRSVEER